jgi:hypothetical protein
MAKQSRQRIRIGPWMGGLNLRDHPQDLKDDELSTALNVDIDDLGGLRQRPMYYYQGLNQAFVDGAGGGGATMPAVQAIESSGYFYAFMFSPVGNTRLLTKKSIESQVNGAWLGNRVHANMDLANGQPLVVYKESMYAVNIKNVYSCSLTKLQAGTALAADWASQNGPLSAGTPASPIASQAVVIKDRLFLCKWQYDGVSPTTYPINRVYWSKVANFGIWAAPDGGFVDVGANFAGSTITRLFSHNDSLIIVKPDGIWRLSWSADPATDGVLDQISNASGFYDGLSYKGRLFFLGPNGFYEFLNSYMVNLSDRVMSPGSQGYAAAPGDRPVITSFAAPGDNSKIGGPTLCGVKDYIFFGVVQYVNWDRFRYAGTYYVNLVYDLSRDRWLAWKADRTSQNAGISYSKPVCANEEVGTVLVCGNNAFSANGCGAYIIPVDSAFWNGYADNDAGDLKGPPYFAIETKTYAFGDPFKWKQFHKLLAWARQAYRPAAGTGNVDFSMTQYTFDQNPVAGSGETTENYAVNITQAETRTALEASSWNGFFPFTKKRFKMMRFRLEGQVNSTVGTGPFLWSVPYIELDVDMKRDVDNRKP